MDRLLISEDSEHQILRKLNFHPMAMCSHNTLTFFMSTVWY